MPSSRPMPDPRKSMVAVFEDLSERFEVQRNRLNQIIEEEIRRSQ